MSPKAEISMSAVNKWRRLRKRLAVVSAEVGDPSPNCVSVLGDSRKILGKLPADSVHAVITSPPYGDQKDYGSADELGWASRDHDEYLDDLRSILKECLRVTVAGGALWVVVDSFRRNKRTIPLPWQIVQLAMSEGWTFHDTVVWDKGRSLPWSHAGHFRSVCEHIFLLGKGPLREFDVESVRELDYLSSYWIRYPERYNPRGKAPGDLWHFPIPVQGSWSQQSSRHCCPFPPGLVAKMIDLTTRRGDVVLDPFGGTGTVAAVASTMKRRGISVDINAAYHRDFVESGYQLITQASMGSAKPVFKKKRDELSRTIMNLRVVKLPRTLFAQLSRADRLGAEARTMIAAFVVRTTVDVAPNQLPVTTVDILSTNEIYVSKLEELAGVVTTIPPLSKFGFSVATRVLTPREWTPAEYTTSLGSRSWFAYKNGNFTWYSDRIPQAKLSTYLGQSPAIGKIPPIVSPIGIRIDAAVTD
jgi:DNA modification methylase